jgi:hypothetical protein
MIGGGACNGDSIIGPDDYFGGACEYVAGKFAITSCSVSDQSTK